MRVAEFLPQRPLDRRGERRALGPVGVAHLWPGNLGSAPNPALPPPAAPPACRPAGRCSALAFGNTRLLPCPGQRALPWSKLDVAHGGCSAI